MEKTTKTGELASSLSAGSQGQQLTLKVKATGGQGSGLQEKF